uniref:Complement component 1, s subcomponent n=1 Tax=Esox lucius TaxID=8010 RepID=A0A3P8YP82_ESOLU
NNHRNSPSSSHHWSPSNSYLFLFECFSSPLKIRTKKSVRKHCYFAFSLKSTLSPVFCSCRLLSVSEFWAPVFCSGIGCGEPEPLQNGNVILISGSQNQHGSLLQYHCNEPFYSLPKGAKVNYTCSLDGKWKDEQNNSLIPQCIPVCGRPTVYPTGFGRIIGGKDAPLGSFPWQVLITDPHKGGGIVIGDYWIMTAAHVLHGNTRQRVKVYVGVKNLENLSESLEVASVFLHPNYNDSEKNYDHDIALIHVKNSISFNTEVMPLCLPTKDSKYTTGKNGYVSGFGLKEEDMYTNNLMYAQVPVVDQETCRKAIEKVDNTSNTPRLTDNMFCAGKPEGGMDSCQGDSGGPYILSEAGQFWAAGIVSWGFGCGQPGKYGVYTRVTNYIDWINKTIEEEEQRTSEKQSKQYSCRGCLCLCAFVQLNNYFWPQRHPGKHSDEMRRCHETLSQLVQSMRVTELAERKK